MHKINLVHERSHGKWRVVETRGYYPAILKADMGDAHIATKTFWRNGTWMCEFFLGDDAFKEFSPEDMPPPPAASLLR